MEKPKILVIDDEAFYTQVLDNLLRDEYIVTSVETGEQALEYLASNDNPDLILLDIVLPGIDGYETCRLIKKDKNYCDIPIIFLTVKGDVDDELRGFDLGAADYISKPMSPPIVRARVRTHIGLAQIRAQLENIIHKRIAS